MYQTVGQDAIEYVANALDVPLYRRIISGSAVDMSSEYGSRDAKKNGALEGDETEDLHELLSAVKAAHPDVQGVSVGAILSNYQRVRVEHVCRRLSLTPLCYLWQRDQAELLAEMVEAGLEAILIKVAGIGLTAKHLGKTLAQMQPTLLKLNSLYGSHVCGEGGEYETLTLDCPIFKRRINLVETETVIHSDSDFATVAYLRVKNATLEEKVAVTVDPTVPPVLEESYDSVRESVEQSLRSQNQSVEMLPYDAEAAILYYPGQSAKRVGSWVVVPYVHGDIDRDSTVPIEDEVKQCFQKLQEQLQKHGLDFSHVASMNIFLSSMDLFARVNAVYGTFFGSSPPARACVAADLPPTHRVQIECVAYAEKHASERQALHVQGLSYWAPANIGPYSQAVTIQDQRIFVSGQIGLLPSTLALPEPRSLATETALACQHAARVVQALQSNSGGGWDGHVQLALYWMVSFDDLPHVRDAVRDLDAEALVLFLGVPALPKDALVEKQVVVHTGRFKGTEDDENEIISATPTRSFHTLTEGESVITYATSSFAHSSAACTTILVKGAVSGNMNCALEDALSDVLDSAVTTKVFYRPSEQLSDPPTFLQERGLSIMPVPCTFVASVERADWDLAICIMGS
ncbi:diphthine--ammonia ligase [Phanerochaete sordida]|uniref:Diphthine--ammonia ligase n=1 Tax=Phanerochaete sordida TaxID=48140 RepID=A0A9P3L732_9APHY|nr:diphthine--ammonia ligase [Phanerochaete sordida]